MLTAFRSLASFEQRAAAIRENCLNAEQIDGAGRIFGFLRHQSRVVRELHSRARAR